MGVCGKFPCSEIFGTLLDILKLFIYFVEINIAFDSDVSSPLKTKVESRHFL